MAISSAVVLGLLFGVIQVCFAFYVHNMIDESAREASRYAIVRGSNCSTNTPSQTNCGATSAEITSYVKSLGLPGVNAGTPPMTVTTTWLTATSSGTPATTTWTACTTGTCNAPGNQVSVNIQYAFPLGIPFWKVTTVTMSSTSRMVISQ